MGSTIQGPAYGYCVDGEKLSIVIYMISNYLVIARRQLYEKSVRSLKRFSIVVVVDNFFSSTPSSS